MRAQGRLHRRTAFPSQLEQRPRSVGERHDDCRGERSGQDAQDARPGSRPVPIPLGQTINQAFRIIDVCFCLGPVQVSVGRVAWLRCRPRPRETAKHGAREPTVPPDVEAWIPAPAIARAQSGGEPVARASLYRPPWSRPRGDPAVRAVRDRSRELSIRAIAVPAFGGARRRRAVFTPSRQELASSAGTRGSRRKNLVLPTPTSRTCRRGPGYRAKRPWS